MSLLLPSRPPLNWRRCCPFRAFSFSVVYLLTSSNQEIDIPIRDKGVGFDGIMKEIEQTIKFRYTSAGYLSGEYR